jgi:hypothetical protein
MAISKRAGGESERLFAQSRDAPPPRRVQSNPSAKSNHGDAGRQNQGARVANDYSTVTDLARLRG